jgi:hypothetical protein
MNIKSHFYFEPSIDLNAAHIGINRWNWDKIEQDDIEMAKSIMSSKRYDVLPIEIPGRRVEEYFATEHWNKFKPAEIEIEKRRIQDAPKIYYRLSFNDLIRKFKNHGSHYYFLINSDDVLGLVSKANLHHQAVYNYMYFVLSDLEKSFRDFFRSNLDEDAVEKLLGEKSRNDKRLTKVLDQYEVAKKHNRDTDIFDCTYITDLSIFLKHFNKLKLKSAQNLNPELRRIGKEFAAKKPYSIIRNDVAHNNTIFSTPESIEHIDHLLSDYQRVKEILSNQNLIIQ